MIRYRPATAAWIACVVAAAILLCACGGGTKGYLKQVVPLVENNDAIDSRVAKLPKINAFKDPDYLEKLDGYIAQKQAIRAQIDTIEPPFMMATTHNQLLVAMNNGIRYLQSEREKFVIAARNMESAGAQALRGTDEFEIIREYQSQTAAYTADVREQLMKQQYERLYYDVKDELERAGKF
jgi:hypothetical protein